MLPRQKECYEHFATEISEILQDQVRLGGEITKRAISRGADIKAFDPVEQMQELVAQSRSCQIRLMEIVMTATIAARYNRKDYNQVRKEVHEQHQEDMFEKLLESKIEA